MSITDRLVNAYIFNGFWEDIGTIKSFYNTNINLASLNPAFNFYEENTPIYTHKRYLPASKINFCTFSSSLAAEGSIITNASIRNSIIGIRSVIESGSDLDGVICMGHDFYETPDQKYENHNLKRPNLGIGKGTIIRGAIIDKNTRIGEGCRIGLEDIPREEGDHGNYYIRDGIIIIPKSSVIPNGTVI
jgi:glucose-1-phosphate adenylyltransferase